MEQHGDGLQQGVRVGIGHDLPDHRDVGWYWRFEHRKVIIEHRSNLARREKLDPRPVGYREAFPGFSICLISAIVTESCSTSYANSHSNSPALFWLMSYPVMSAGVYSGVSSYVANVGCAGRHGARFSGIEIGFSTGCAQVLKARSSFPQLFPPLRFCRKCYSDIANNNMELRRQKQNNLVVYRRKMGFTQKHVARLLGHGDASMVSHYEHGRALPPLVVALSLEIIYRTPVAFLFPGMYEGLKQRIRQQEQSLTDPGQ